MLVKNRDGILFDGFGVRSGFRRVPGGFKALLKEQSWSFYTLRAILCFSESVAGVKAGAWATGSSIPGAFHCDLEFLASN